MTDFDVPEAILDSPFEEPAEHWEITPEDRDDPRPDSLVAAAGSERTGQGVVEGLSGPSQDRVQVL